MSRLRVALVGSRGIPGRYGGYETLFTELAPRLVARGFEVTVYCRTSPPRPGDRIGGRSGTRPPLRRASFRGARLVHLPTLRTKHLDTPVHTLLSCLHAAGERFDAALVVNSANALFLPLLSAAGTPTLLNVDGIEKRRAKWGAFGRAVFALSERLACVLPDRLVTDAEVIRAHYVERYAAPSEIVTYGVDARPLWQSGVLRRLGVEKRGYFLYVSRFEPENNPHRVIAAFARVGGEKSLYGILAYETEPIVSSDILHSTYSGTFDSLSTMVVAGRVSKTLTFFDNGWGYCHRVIDLLRRLSTFTREDAR